MKISERWLRELINPCIDTNTLIEQMIMIGLEVNNLEPVKNLFSGVLLGKVVECRQHPNVFIFKILKVDIGKHKLFNIVCNYQECNVDEIVAVAIPGTILPGNKKVDIYKCYGELSEGIICSFSELGLGENKEMISFPHDTPVGMSLENFLNFPDNILDINVLPNRADCSSVMGMAREISVINSLSVSTPKFKLITPTIDDRIPISIQYPPDCPRYIGRVIKKINVNTITPLWMREKLRRSGINSVNIINDILNYILIELGQPIQIIDLSDVKDGIFIRKAQDKESLWLSNGNRISLSSDTLVMSNKISVLSIAGILNINKINHLTKDILVSIAFFPPLLIQNEVNKYKLHTDISYYYGRGVDPSLQYYAIERATSLLVSICGGYVGQIMDHTNAEFLPKLTPLHLRKSKLDKLIGYSIPNEKVNYILTSLGYKVTNINDGWKVITPSWRFDVDIEEDLVEDIIRIYGYDQIPIIPLHYNKESFVEKKTKFSLDRVKTLLVDRSYQEIISYSFVNPQIQQILYPSHIPLSLINPITIEMSVMRISLWTGLLCTVIYNQHRQYRQIRLFESGLCFSYQKANLQINQHFMLAGVISGFRFSDHWDVNREDIDFYDAKGDVESIFELMGKLDNIKFKRQINSALHPGKSAAIYFDQELIGFIGVIHPEIKKKLNLTGNCVLFELFWEKINKYDKPLINNLSKFPSNRRDISIIVSDEINAADIIDTCKEVIGNKLVNIKLFDIFKGNSIEKGYKSLSISLILQASNYTMEEKEINSIIRNCNINLQHKFGAYLRN